MSKITLVVPSYGGGPNIERTIASVSGVCDEVVIVSTALFPEDVDHFKKIANKVVELPWNFVFLHGYGSLNNQGTAVSSNDWLLLFGTGETLAEQYRDMKSLTASRAQTVFRCNHVNDPYTWKRMWNRQSGSHWSGIIHEEIVQGVDGGVVFRMQDTDKSPRENKLQQDAMRWVKALSYNHLYHELILRPERVGGASHQWLKFVAGAREYIEKFVSDHNDMMQHCLTGDLGAFLAAVEKRGAGAGESLVSHQPQGS